MLVSILFVFKDFSPFPAGILCVADHCQGLRELALNYYMLSDELLLALSNETHVNLEHLRIDVVSENAGQIEFHSIKRQSWDALIKHSPGVNVVMYFFLSLANLPHKIKTIGSSFLFKILIM